MENPNKLQDGIIKKGMREIIWTKERKWKKVTEKQKKSKSDGLSNNWLEEDPQKRKRNYERNRVKEEKDNRWQNGRDNKRHAIKRKMKRKKN